MGDGVESTYLLPYGEGPPGLVAAPVEAAEGSDKVPLEPRGELLAESRSFVVA